MVVETQFRPLMNIKGDKGDRGPAGTFEKVTALTVPSHEPAAAFITGPEDARELTLHVPMGPIGLPGVNAVDNDEAFAAYLASPGSASHEAVQAWLSSRFAVSIKDFGAVGDGVTDDTAAIQAALNTGARVVFAPTGRFVFTHLTVSTPHQALFGMGSYGGHTILEKKVREAGAGVRVEEEGFAMRGIILECTAPSDDDLISTGIHAERLPTGPGGTQRTSVDLDVRDCVIRGWYRGIFHRGQGLTVIGTNFSNIRWGIDLDFNGDNWQDVGDPNQHGAETAFRMYRLIDNRIHAIREAFVRNVGPWATYIRTVHLDGLIGDIGGEIWRGALADALITNVTISMTHRPWVMRLSTGSRDYVVSNVRVTGRRATSAVEERSPTRFLLAEGQQSNFEFRDITVEHVRQHGFTFEGPVHAGRFRNVTFHDVGYQGRYSLVRFEDVDTQATIRGFEIHQIEAEAATPIFVRNGGPETDIKADDLQFVGSVIPEGGFISPVQGAIANRRSTGAPTGGYWKRGDIIWRANAQPGGTIGWMCTAEGRPGSWHVLQHL